MKETVNVVPWLVCFCFIVAFILTVQPAQAKEKEILIGAHIPLSGLLAQIGAEQKWAYDLAVKKINENRRHLC